MKIVCSGGILSPAWLLLIAGALPTVAAEPKVFSLDFESTPAGALPEGFVVAETNGRGTTATWAVVLDETAPTPRHAVAVTTSPNTGRTYNVLLSRAEGPVDLDLTVAVRAGQGAEDQGGGPIWRAADAANYMIARWNPLEDNFRIYRVVGGKRSQIAGKDLEIDPLAWHTIRIRHIGGKIESWLDGEPMLTITEENPSPAGARFGLWTKADAATLFDDLIVKPAL